MAVPLVPTEQNKNLVEKRQYNQQKEAQKKPVEPCLDRLGEMSQTWLGRQNIVERPRLQASFCCKVFWLPLRILCLYHLEVSASFLGFSVCLLWSI